MVRGVGWRTSIAARIPYSPGTALLGKKIKHDQGAMLYVGTVRMRASRRMCGKRSMDGEGQSARRWEGGRREVKADGGRGGE